MRAKLITISVTLLLLAAISVTEQLAVRRVTQRALGEAQAILSDIRQGTLADAPEKAHALDEAWDRQAKLLEMMVDHRSTDDVRYALSRLMAALESGDSDDAMIYAGELEGGIEHVCERQVLTLENLL